MEYRKITHLHNKSILFNLKKNYFILKNRSFLKKDVLKLLLKVYIKGKNKIDYSSYLPELYNLKKKKIFRIRKLNKNKNLGTDLFLNKFKPVPLYFNRFIRELSLKKKLFFFIPGGYDGKKNWRFYFHNPTIKSNKFYKKKILFMLTHLSPFFTQYPVILSLKNSIKRSELLRSGLGGSSIGWAGWASIYYEEGIGELWENFIFKNKKNFDWYYEREINLGTNKVQIPKMSKYDVESVAAISKRYLRAKLLGQADPGLFSRDRRAPLTAFFKALILRKNFFMVRLINEIIWSKRNNFTVFSWSKKKKKKAMKKKKKMLITYNKFTNDVNSK